MTWTSWDLRDTCPGGWSHHNLAAAADGSLVGFHPGDRALVRFSPAGELVRVDPCEAIEAHDVVAVPEGFWLADCGHKLCGDWTSKPPVAEAVGRVWLVAEDGSTLRVIQTIDHPTYAAGGQLLPTGIAPDERGLWVADGYGSNLVHLVSPADELLLTIDGGEDGLDCPHGIRIDERGSEPVVVLAERGKARLRVHDLDGGFVRFLGEGSLLAPCAVAFAGELTIVADLTGRVTVLDADGALVEHLGAHPDGMKRPGWPNCAHEDRAYTAPHGLTVLDGSLFVTEWTLGGRWVRTDVPATG